MSLPIQSLSSAPRNLINPIIHHHLHLPSRLSLQNHNQTLQIQSSPTKIQCLKPIFTDNLFGFSARKNLGFGFGRQLGFCVRAETGEGESKNGVDLEAEGARGESTMPSRFRYLTKEAPDPPIRWPWFVGNISIYL